MIERRKRRTISINLTEPKSNINFFFFHFFLPDGFLAFLMSPLSNFYYAFFLSGNKAEERRREKPKFKCL